MPGVTSNSDMTPADRLLDAWSHCPIVAIYRGAEPFDAAALCGALFAGGLRTVEITMNTPGACEAIRAVRASLSDDGSEMIGAGTVLTVDDAGRAVSAGAQFLVAPTVDEAVIGWAVDAGVPILPGAFTPTEAWRAQRLGAAAVKLFPANALGPTYLREVLAPLSELRLVATGNLGLNEVPAYLAAGAAAVGVGPTLIDPEAVSRQDWPALTRLAERWMADARAARG
ncbi:MAG: bifunctional 4-hydroxy-2-oxoglutarate aldolase/2-dehydro-3-deoxy-phosphogluconate aldolase [Planctomycetota bacterium]